MPTLLDRHGPLADPHPAPVPLSDWLADRDAVRAAAGDRAPAVLLGPADDPEALAADLPSLGLVAIDFPRFTDGRGRSVARLLRERLGWKGPLRAVGDVAVDQMYALARCGFDQFALRDGDDPTTALKALTTFHEAYQAAVDRGPLFARRFGLEDAR